jgi:hypothetical protein
MNHGSRITAGAPARIRTTVYNSPFSAFKSVVGLFRLVQWRARQDFDHGDELDAQDIEVGIPFPKVGNRLT